MKASAIDEFSSNDLNSELRTTWRLVTDGVMGGKSKGQILHQLICGRNALRMLGEVSLADDGGFVQVTLDLADSGKAMDASMWEGIEIDVLGNSEEYELRLRTRDLERSWQSYRQPFFAESNWKSVKLPFDRFERHRTQIYFDARRLHRVGIIAIGREFSADVALSGIRFYS